MKISKQDVIKKTCFGIDIFEYKDDGHAPLDFAVVHFRNNTYPEKTNHDFHEAFYVLSGNLIIEIGNDIHHLDAGDLFIIEPKIKHTSRAEFADVLIICTPPFDIKNIEFSQN